MKTKPTKIEDAFWESFDKTHGWYVPDEWQKELHNYVVRGLMPGSFHTALYASDLMGAINRTHPSNTWAAIVSFCKWLEHIAPPQCWGSYGNVEKWLDLTKEERKKILEEKGLLYTEKEVTWNILNQK